MKKKHILIMSASLMLLASCNNGSGENKEIKPVNVTTTTVSETASGNGQSFSGTIEETEGSVLSFSVSGTLRSVNVTTGSKVSKGQLIAVVDEATLRNTYDMASATLRQAEDAYRRMKQLHDSGSLPEMQWIEVQSKLQQAQASERIAKKSLNDSRLYAPFSGVISEKNAEAGQNVMPGTPIVKLVKTQQVKVKIAVPENEISAFSTGQPVDVTVSALGGKSFTGRISEIGVEANPLTRSYEVKAVISNGSGELMPGMVCDAFVSHDTSSRNIILPAHIVQIDNENRQFVWINKNGTAHKCIIETGELTGKGIVVVSGLSNGDEVLTEGQQKVSEGTKIKTKNNKDKAQAKKAVSSPTKNA